MENTENIIEEKTKRKRRRPGHPSRRQSSKRHLENCKKVDKTRQYTLEEAVALLKDAKNCKFNEAVEITMKLGVDPRKSDQMVRGSVSLPKGIGKQVKVLVFAEGDLAEAAKNAGADYVGSVDLVEKITNESWMDFDIAIAHPNMMKYLSKLGKVLGPKGKMPSPKSGTVTPDVAKAVTEFKAGKVEYRTDSGGNVHAPIGKKNFVAQDIIVNAETFMEHIKHVRPSTAKGTYIQKVVISSSMGPGIPIELKRN